MRPTIAILGCGWLGEPLAAYLLSQGYRVKGSTTSLDRYHRLAEVGVLPFLLTAQPTLMGEGIGDFFAADVLVVTLPPKPPQAVQTVFSHLITLAQQGGIRRVLYTSSTGVYGNAMGNITEATPVAPNSDAGAAVCVAEQLLLQSNIPTTVLRLGGLIGGNRHPVKYLAGKTGLPQGNAPVNLVHRYDVIAAIAALLACPANGDTIYNVCTDDHPSRAAYYTAAAAAWGLPLPQFLPDTATDYKVIVSEKIKTALKFRFTHSLFTWDGSGQ